MELGGQACDTADAARCKSIRILESQPATCTVASKRRGRVSFLAASVCNDRAASGDLAAEQPKAAGSSVLYKLTNFMTQDAFKIAGMPLD